MSGGSWSVDQLMSWGNCAHASRHVNRLSGAVSVCPGDNYAPPGWQLIYWHWGQQTSYLPAHLTNHLSNYNPQIKHSVWNCFTFIGHHMKHSMTRVLARVDHDDDDEVCYGCCGPMWAGSDARTLLIDCTETLALPAANYPLSLSDSMDLLNRNSGPHLWHGHGPYMVSQQSIIMIGEGCNRTIMGGTN